MFKVNVKWGKQTFKEVELDTSEDATTFMTQLYALSNVPVDKQKIMVKGAKIKEDTDMTKLKLKDNLTIMMMGTAEGKHLVEPVKQTLFEEDLTPEQRAKIFKEKTGKALPAGLVNLGNTWYMNSMVQVFSKSKELKDGIYNYTQSAEAPNNDGQLVVAAKSMYKDLESKGESFPPYSFVQALRMLYPQFDETDNQGRHMQQDSDEFFQALMRSYESTNMKFIIGDEEKNLVNHLFEIEFEVTVQNTMSDEEEKQVTYEKSKKLMCHIDGAGKPINHLMDGLNLSLEGEIEKFSDTTQQQNVYKKTQKLNNLPSYLCVQMVRFFWKKASSTAGTQATKSKILRNVSFPMVLDAYDLCSDELKESLNHGRQFEAKLREEYDEKMLSGQNMTEDAKMEVDGAKPEGSGDATMEPAESKEEEKVETKTTKKKKVKEASIKDNIVYREHGTGLDHGKYQLVGVVTHQGRTADSGHYIGWIHESEDDWYQCDDDLVSQVKTEDIIKLKGGGDWHMAYFLLYRKLEVCKGDEI